MSVKIKRPLTNEEYCAQDGVRCPYCESNEIEGSSIQIDGSTAWQPIHCLDCENRWSDIYTLVAYDPID